MRKIIQSRKRSRIFGIQPVGFLHRPMSPRVGIFAWVIPAKLSPWTFEEGRLADLPNLVVDDHWGASAHPPFWQQVRCFPHRYHPRRRFRLKTRPQSTPSIPKPAQPCESLLRRHRSALSFNSHPILIGGSEQPKL